MEPDEPQRLVLAAVAPSIDRDVLTRQIGRDGGGGVGRDGGGGSEGGGAGGWGDGRGVTGEASAVVMPKKAESGSTTIDLLEYLFGPGEREEHTDLHLVAAWGPGLPCQARIPDRMTLADLALILDAPVEALRGPRPDEHMWHASVRNAPGDRLVSDAEWAEVAAGMVHAAGIAPYGDEQACRWVAVRHADDHIHIAATLARQDGRHPRLRGDIPAMHTAARAVEYRARRGQVLLDRGGGVVGARLRHADDAAGHRQEDRLVPRGVPLGGAQGEPDVQLLAKLSGSSPWPCRSRS